MAYKSPEQQAKPLKRLGSSNVRTGLKAGFNKRRETTRPERALLPSRIGSAAALSAIA